MLSRSVGYLFKICEFCIVMSADFMALLCGIRINMNNFSKSTRARDMLLLYLSRMINRKIHADLSVRLFARVIRREVPPPKV